MGSGIYKTQGQGSILLYRTVITASRIPSINTSPIIIADAITGMFYVPVACELIYVPIGGLYNIDATVFICNDGSNVISTSYLQTSAPVSFSTGANSYQMIAAATIIASDPVSQPLTLCMDAAISGGGGVMYVNLMYFIATRT